MEIACEKLSGARGRAQDKDKAIWDERIAGCLAQSPEFWRCWL